MSQKRKGKYRYDLYEIRWIDAEGEAGWSDPKGPITPVPCINIGFLIREDDEYVKLAAAYIDKFDDDSISSTDIIPKRMITSMKKLKVSYEKPKVTPVPTTA